MQIIHIVENLDNRYGGPANVIPLLAKYLNKLEIKNKIISIQIWNDEKNDVLNKYGLFFCKKKALDNKFRYSIKLKQLIMKHITKDTIIHINGVWNYISYISYKIAVTNNIPYIVSPRGTFDKWALHKNRFIKKIFFHFYVKDMLKNTNIIHVTSEKEKNEILDLNLTNDIYIIPDGVELKNDYNYKDNDLLQKISYNRDKRYIMFLGRIVENKGLHYLINSYNKLKERYRKVEVLVVGGIEDKKYFNGLENIDGVKFLGQLDGIAKHTVFSISNLFVLPTYTENFGVVIAEAMSYKLPIITTTGTPWKEIKEKDAGWWIKLSQENLDKVLEEALSLSDEELKIKGENGYNIIQNYTWDKQALKMRKIYNKILKGEK